MKSSGLILSHTLTIMCWQIELSLCRMGPHFIQQGYAINVLPMRQLMSFCGHQRIQISIPFRTCGRLYQGVSMSWIHCREMQLSFMQRAQWMAEHHKGVHTMMTSSNWNIFRVTGHLCREFTGDAELWCFHYCFKSQFSETIYNWPYRSWLMCRNIYQSVL